MKQNQSQENADNNQAPRDPQYQPSEIQFNINVDSKDGSIEEDTRGSIVNSGGVRSVDSNPKMQISKKQNLEMNKVK